MEEGYSTRGEVFTVPVAHKRVTFLIGPDAAPHFFKATDDEMSQTEVYNFNVPTFGKGVVYDVDQKVGGREGGPLGGQELTKGAEGAVVGGAAAFRGPLLAPISAPRRPSRPTPDPRPVFAAPPPPPPFSNAAPRCAPSSSAFSLRR
jgi:hypothetical protein